MNFTDYLDTGLFLDHRPTRARIRELAKGKRFLNLFAYTCTARVFAAAGGAVATTSVDLSRTYLDWARRNFELNGFRDSSRHQLLQEDVVEWLAAAGARALRPDLPRPADVVAVEAHGRRARRAARPRAELILARSRGSRPAAC